ncbi:hypothetical protein RhiirC2_791591 [Rhizophagus irregularis]|uniref:Uncharacterized protein n=3 Tax=Rhizophagus irregularis TaxID=588596 RepID=A0A2N1MJ09_9GLOM|nr:hypothetical protein RhiirC2_791591 [Rhizophagus irregularis]
MEVSEVDPDDISPSPFDHPYNPQDDIYLIQASRTKEFDLKIDVRNSIILLCSSQKTMLIPNKNNNNTMEKEQPQEASTILASSTVPLPPKEKVEEFNKLNEVFSDKAKEINVKAEGLQTSLGTTTIKDSKKRIALVQGERDDDSEKDSIIE